MAPNNDDILTLILAERGEGDIHSDTGFVASDPRSAEAYRELSAVAAMAQSARASEHAWRDRAVSRAMESVRDSRRSDFRLSRPARAGAFRMIAAAAGVALAIGAAIAYLSQTPSPVRVTDPMAAEAPIEPTLQAQPVYRMAVASQPNVLSTPFGQYRSLAEGIDSAADGSTLQIQASNSDEVLRVSKPIKVFAIGGTVRIGARQ